MSRHNHNLFITFFLLFLFFSPFVINAQFDVSLEKGQKGEKVTLLQKVLNAIGKTVAPSPEPGSLGNETNYFGDQTAQALRAFQCEQGIVCSGDESTTGWGRLGPKTRSALNSIISRFLSVFSFFTSSNNKSQLAQVASSLQNGLVAHYTFDDGSGSTANDSSGNGNHGTLQGGPTWTAGKIGTGALQFDGVDDVVNAGSGSSLDNLGPMSVSFWINPNSWGEGSQGYIATKTFNCCGTNQGWIIKLLVTGSKIEFHRDYDGSSDLYAYTSFSSSDFGKWTHWTITWDGTSSYTGVKFYKNGVSQTVNGTNGVGNIVSDASQSLFLGNDAGSRQRTFDGVIDELRIYNRILTDDEVSALYNLSSGTSSPPPSSPPASPPPPTNYTLTVSKSGTGSGTITGTGINCGTDCTETLANGTTITLTATPNTGSTFAGWSGACYGTGNTCTITITNNTSVTATFNTATVTGPRVYTVKKDGTGDFTTIQACADVAQAGDTCLVGEGNYGEKVVTKRGGTATNESACVPLSGNYPNYIINNLSACDAKRITFKAQGNVTTTSFSIDHPFITLDGFRFTGPASQYYGYIVVYKNGNYCQILNNTVFGGDNGVQGINIYTSNGQAANNCVIRGNRLSNLNYTFLVTSGSRHLVESNIFEYQNSWDYIRLFGNDILFRRNIFQLGVAKPGSGSHPDFVQTFGTQSMRSYNHVFEENWIENMESQFSQLSSSAGEINQPGATNLLYDNIHSITFRRNVIVNLTHNGNIVMPNVRFENNTFYKLATQLGGMSAGGSLSRGDASNTVFKNNIFLESGSSPTAVGGQSGFYSLSGASFSTEVIAIFVTKENQMSSSPIAKEIVADLQLGYLDASGYLTYKFNLLSNSSKLVLSATYAPYRDQVYQAIKTAADNNRALTTADLGFLPGTLSKSSLIAELKEGYINSNGKILLKGRAINNIEDFIVNDIYAVYKSALFDYFTKTKILDDSIVNSFYANYNYVAGAASAGFPPKKSSNCDGTGKYVAFNFCELNGINGGDPKLQNINNPRGPDGVPFTLDDGLKPLPGSILCGKGENGVDIGAYSCDPNVVLANLSSPTQTNYTLTVFKSGSGSGIVTGVGINCGSDCSETLASGITITLTATPNTGSTFAGWSGACSGTANTCTITITNNANVTATFNTQTDITPPSISSVVVTNITQNSATITWTTNEPADSQVEYGLTTSYGNTTPLNPTLTTTHSVTLTGLSPNTAYNFRIKSKDAFGNLATTNNQTFKTLSQTNYTLTVSKSGTGSGTITGTGINCGTDCTETLASGTTITLTATPTSGSTFAGWSGACSGTAKTCTITITSNTSVTATFNTTTVTGPRVYTVKKDGTGDFTTIQACADVAQAGDTCLVSAGNYSERVSLPSNKGGTSNAKIIFKAEPRRSVYMNGFVGNRNNYIRIEGFSIIYDNSDLWLGGGIWIDGNYWDIVDNYFEVKGAAIQPTWLSGRSTNNIYVANNRMYKCNKGFVVSGDGWLVENNEVERLIYYAQDADYSRFFGTNHVIRNNYFHGTLQEEIGSSHTDGFQTFDNNGNIARNIIIENNKIFGFYHQGIMIGNATEGAMANITVRNNIFNSSASMTGINAYGVSGLRVYNNVFAYTRSTSVLFRAYTGGPISTGEVKNNIFYNVGHNYSALDGSIINASNNITFGGGTFASRDPSRYPNDLVNVDPKFVNPSEYDFRLQPSSPAIDAGISIDGFNYDILGTSRPQGAAWDIGAYEYVSGVVQSPSNYTLTVSKSGSGSGIVTGVGINCGSDCSETLASGATITLTTTPNTGSTFAGWSGACSGTANTCTITITNNTNVTATFNTTTQSGGGSVMTGGGGGGSAAGGGGGGTSAYTPVPTPTSTGGGSGVSVPSSLSTTTSNSAVSTSTSQPQLSTSTRPAPLSLDNIRNMPYGSKGETIKTIQEILIRLGYLSSGNNTGYYGPLTKQALENYIKSTQPTNTISTSTSAMPTNANASPSPANAQPYTFNRSLKLGDKGEDVRQLQIFLNNQGFTIANSGPGSKGNETTFFGLATRNALIRFQNAYRSEILTPFNLKQGTGYFGPATIRKVNDLMRR